MSFSITNTTKSRPPILPFLDIKNAILGGKYDLSLVFIGDTRSRSYNRLYRNNDKPTNVLAFPLSPNDGEIFINLKQAHKEAHRYHEPRKKYIAFLFIHALLHLKGHQHSSTMESEERKWMKKFGLA